MWRTRVTHPRLTSRIILTIDENARFVSATYSMDTNSPVRICRVRVMPKRNPRFHKKEIEVGEGKSRRDFFIIEVIGFIFSSCFFIKMTMKGFV